ncbi:MAG: F0F1 ATP synthase subunit A [Eubacteriales bacterium]|nr:F0F1 ATP synthase subunit A [Eubacteriales bacterium]
METPSVGKILVMTVSLLIGAGALFLRARIPLPAKEDATFIPAKKKRNLLMFAGVLSLWVFTGLVLGLFGTGDRTLQVTISPARVDLFGFSVSSSVAIAWIVMAALILFAVLVRIFAVPRFQEKPRGLQLVLETAVEAISNFAKEKFGHENDGLAAYFFALAALFIGSAVVELFGFRPPTTDLSMTLSYALVTFVLINYFGIRKKGVKGRLKTLTKPVAVVAPFKLLSDIAVPVSLACRLFGNMLGGMIVVDLLYYALGAFSVGIPAVLGLYFNVFHPLIQFFIFINLSLTFIGEAVED